VYLYYKYFEIYSLVKPTGLNTITTLHSTWSTQAHLHHNVNVLTQKRNMLWFVMKYPGSQINLYFMYVTELCIMQASDEHQ
jgi:hypothetical protein